MPSGQDQDANHPTILGGSPSLVWLSLAPRWLTPRRHVWLYVCCCLQAVRCYSSVLVVVAGFRQLVGAARHCAWCVLWQPYTCPAASLRNRTHLRPSECSKTCAQATRGNSSISVGRPSGSRDRRLPFADLSRARILGSRYLTDAKTVVMFAVTSCSLRFHPTFNSSGGPSVELQGSTFADLDGKADYHLFNSSTSGDWWVYDVQESMGTSSFKAFAWGISDACGRGRYPPTRRLGTRPATWRAQGDEIVAGPDEAARSALGVRRDLRQHVRRIDNKLR